MTTNEIEQLRAERDALSRMLRGMARKARRYDQVGEMIARKADTEVAELRRKLAAGREIHTRAAWTGPNGVEIASCYACHEKWPCPTVRSLGADDATEDEPPELPDGEVSRTRYPAPDQLAHEGPRGVTLRHGPTGLEASAHTERSALQNTVIAYRELQVAVAAARAARGVEA